MVKILASFYRKIPVILNGVESHLPVKNFQSDFIAKTKFTSIIIKNELYAQLIPDDSLYKLTVYDKKDPEKNNFTTLCVNRSRMPEIMTNCDSLITRLMSNYNEFLKTYSERDILNLCIDIAQIRKFVSNVYLSGGAYYLEINK